MRPRQPNRGPEQQVKFCAQDTSSPNKELWRAAGNSLSTASGMRGRRPSMGAVLTAVGAWSVLVGPQLAAAQEFDWSCDEAVQATPCMSGVECPLADVVDKAACQRLCERTAGCVSIVHQATQCTQGQCQGDCYLKGVGDSSSGSLPVESCTKARRPSSTSNGHDEEVHGYSWSLDCILWGAGCTAASPLPWLMAGFFAMWNTAVSQMLVVPILRFCYFGCGDRTARKMCYALVCPHWALGLAMPWFLGGVVAWFLAVVVPYFRMIKVSAELCKMERDQPQEQREGVQLQDDAIAALEQVTGSINSRRGRMSRAEIWAEVDRLQTRLGMLRGENQEGLTTVVVQAEAIPDNLQGGGLGGEVQIARPLDATYSREAMGLSFDPSAHFAVGAGGNGGGGGGEGGGGGGGGGGAPGVHGDMVQTIGTTASMDDSNRTTGVPPPARTPGP
jgi:uncharacterized membrane protein YgcG